jgi:hypothetical protein
MSKFSLTLTGVVVSVAGTLLMKYGFSESCSNELITNTPLLIGGIITWIGRVRQGDVNLFGMRR